MPILQNNLVMKSIEALHDEALSLMPDTAKNLDVVEPPAVLRAAKPAQELPIESAKYTLANTPPEPADDHDIMARIDQLLEKLDENNDVAIAPLAEQGSGSNTGNKTSNASHTATQNNLATDNPANPDRPVLPDAADKAFSETSNKASNDASDDMFANDQTGEAPPNQTQALADIAEAIYQARKQVVDGDVAYAIQNNAAPLDMNALSATVADEVRRSVSAVIIAELPQMVRDAVGEAIRALPVDSGGHFTLTNVNPSTAKEVTPRQTVAISKTAKARTKKAKAKKAIDKKTPNKKASAKKGKSKKGAAKKTATSA